MQIDISSVNGLLFSKERLKLPSLGIKLAYQHLAKIDCSFLIIKTILVKLRSSLILSVKQWKSRNSLQFFLLQDICRDHSAITGNHLILRDWIDAALDFELHEQEENSLVASLD